MRSMTDFIYQHKNWPDFKWDSGKLIDALGEVRNIQGRLLGKMGCLGFELRNEAALDTMTLEVVGSSEIEGVTLDKEQVRSSVARHLGIDIAGSLESDRNVEGIVDMMIDATQNYRLVLSEERLFAWHSALFPSGRSGIRKIIVASWRTDSRGPMQVVSGAIRKEKAHFQAPEANLVAGEMKRFIEWFNREDDTDLVLKSAVAHLWFVTIHPFDDGNGRIARALTDQLLARSDKSSQRFYSMSARIQLERKEYYRILEKTQRGDPEITDWLRWFLNCLHNALKSTESIHTRVMHKAAFWNTHSTKILNTRQQLMLNRILDGSEGKLTSSKWAGITKCSADTALRDIQDLMVKGILKKDEKAGGRSTNYKLV
jgi:Fic family protein